MTLLGITALIVVVVLGLLVLRVKSDPMEKESVRRYLADSAGAPSESSKGSQAKVDDPVHKQPMR